MENSPLSSVNKNPSKKNSKDNLSMYFFISKKLLKGIASTGDVDQDLWTEIRNYITVAIRETLDRYNEKYKDSKTFED